MPYTPGTDKVDPNTYRPLNDWVLVRKRNRKLMSEGGIALPEETSTPVHNEHTIADVVAVGPGKYVTQEIQPGMKLSIRTPLDVKVGDCVVIDPYKAHVVNLVLDLKLMLIPASEILAVCEGDTQELTAP